MAADDFAAGPTTTGVLPLGGSVGGTFETSGDVDWVAITLSAGQSVEISGPSWLKSILFYDASSQPVEVDFFQALSGQTKSAGFTAQTSGTYYVAVTGIGVGATYRLNAKLTSGTHPNDVDGFTTLTNGASAGLNAGESKWHAVQLAAGQTVVVDGVSAVRFYSVYGQSLDSVDRVGETSNDPFSYFTAPQSGTYYIQLAAPTTTVGGGPYTYNANFLFDDNADGLGAYGGLVEPHRKLNPVGDQVSGVIEMMSDIDGFDVDLVAGETVRIRLEFAELHSFVTKLEVTYGQPTYGQGGSFVAQLRSEQAGEVIFTAPVTGSYHLDVVGSHTYVGQYKLTLDAVSAGAAFDGLPNIVSAPPARPAQTTHATTIDWTTAGSHAVDAATTIYTKNIDVVGQPPGSPYFGYGGSPALQTSNFPLFNSTLTNAGTIRNYNDTGGDAAGVGVDKLVNTGSIIAEVANPYWGVSYTLIGVATTVKLNGSLDNSGLIFAGATMGTAIGVFTTSSGKTLTNSGVIAATATMAHDPTSNGGAIAVDSSNDLNIVNTSAGKILAESDGAAIAIDLGRNGSVVNSGLIEAHARGVHATSIGIKILNLNTSLSPTGGNIGNRIDVDNYGTIRADIAILGGDTASTTTRPPQIVVNHAGALIEGEIRLDLGNDVVRNQGVITGRVDMGGDNDTFDNTGGRVNGVVDMGAQNDTFIGGDHADIVLGGMGDDTLTGGAGADLLLGGHGGDTLTGGADADGLYGEFGDDRLVAQGGDVADGGTGDDRIQTLDLGFASIVGGPGHDVWVLPVGGRTLDLGFVAASGRVQSVDEIELTGAQTLVIRAADLAGVSGGPVLYVSGAASAGDAVYLSGAWVAGATVARGAVTYVTYAQAGTTVLVDTDVSVSFGDAPPAGVGLDAVATGAAPAPGSVLGATLSTAEINVSGYAVYDVLTIDSEQIWQNLRGGSVLSGNGDAVGVVNHGVIRSIGSADADIMGPTGSAFAFSTNTIKLLDNSGLILAEAHGAGHAQAYIGSSRETVVNRAAGQIHAIADEGNAIAFNGADTGPIGQTTVRNLGDIYAFSASGFAVGLAERNGVQIDNAGTIEADGGDGAIGVDLSNAGGTVINSGQILAYAPDASTYYSVGVIFYSTAKLENKGVIAADIAVNIIGRYGSISTITNSGSIYGHISKTYWQGESSFGALNVTNTGQIFGSILNEAGASASTIVNGGRIDGDIAFGSGADTYDGRSGVVAGTVDGGAGNDTFYGGRGNETFVGGAGFDTANFSSEAAAVFAHLGWGYAAGRASLGASAADIGVDSLDSIEGLIGGAGNDILISAAGANTVSGGAGADWIEDIGGGNDTLNGEAGADVVFGAAGDDKLSGGIGDDALLGGIGNDVLDGSDGIDWIYGGLGADTIAGGAGNDVLFGAEGGEAASTGDLADSISGGDGDDALIGEEGNDTLNGDAGNDWVYGGDGTDTINGGDGDDVLIGGDGAGGADAADAITGGNGNDALVGQAGDDVLDAGAGNDWAYGGEGNDTISGGAGNDVLAGENGDDMISGGDGDDFIFGGNGYDTLTGGAGNDWIEGSFGGARITGGAGADNLFGGDNATFVYTAVSDSTEAAADVIGIFWRPGGDKIDVSAIDADGNANNGDGAFTFVSAFTNVAGQAVISYDGTNSIARFDTNGDGASDMSIVVLATQLQAADFVA